MKKILTTITILLLIALLACCFVACDEKPGNGGGNQPNGGDEEEFVPVDYVSQLKLDLTSNTAKVIDVKVKSYIDGDTTHFFVDDSVVAGGVLKARYLAIDTPESTGKIEAYGHKASRFTKEKLQSAVSIVIESDESTWKVDSTGSRYLTWVWYKATEDSDYRNLNLEILQNGLALASNTSQNRYGTTAVAALNQAQKQKLNVFSGVADPELFVGDALPVTLKALRCNLAEYENTDSESYCNKKVAFEGIVVRNTGSNSVYVESIEADPDTGLYYGMFCYYGFSMSGTGLEVLNVGNHVMIVGTVQYYENGNTYQISGMQYREFKPDDPDNIKLLDDQKHSASYHELDVQKFVDEELLTIEFDSADEVKTLQVKYPELIMDSTVSVTGLTVVYVSTTDNEESASNGAMTLTCKTQDGLTIKVRTTVLRDANKNIITASAYLNKTIDVKGVVGYFHGYQVKVFSANDITVH